MTKPIQIIFYCCALLFLPACFSIKPATTRSPGLNYESFFVGTEGIQYFIKPIVFQQNDGGSEIHADFTFRYKETITQEDSVTVNYSIHQYEIVNDLNYISFRTSEKKLLPINAERLFAEKRNNQFVSRFTSMISLLDVIMVLSDDNPIIATHHTNDTIKYYLPNRKTKRTLKSLQNNLFVIIE